MSKDNEDLKKELQDRLDRVSEHSQFEKSMGEREFSIQFSDGFAEDLIEMERELDPEEEAAKKREYHKRLERLLFVDKELVFYTDTYMLESITDRCGNIVMEAYAELTGMEEVPIKLDRRGLCGWCDVHFVTRNPREDGEALDGLFFTDLYKHDYFFHDQLFYIAIIANQCQNDLYRRKSALSHLFPNDEEDIDTFWKSGIYGSKPPSVKKILSVEPLEKSAVVDLVEQELETMKGLLYEHKVDYDRENPQEYFRDEQVLQDALSELKELEMEDAICEEDRDKIVIPEKHNSISNVDIANKIRDMIAQKYPEAQYRLRSATYEEQSLCQKPFFEKLESRLPSDRTKKKRLSDPEIYAKYNIHGGYNVSYDVKK